MGWRAKDMGDLTGKVVVITGANSGLGLVSARCLARAGARVVMACRDATRAAEARAEVAAESSGADPVVVALDLGDLDSVRSCVEEVSRSFERVDVLMNNAGVMALPLRRSPQGHESQFATNHLGHFALTVGLLGPLGASPDPRVVTTSSFMHRMGKMRWDDLDWQRGYRKWEAYGQSKLANLLFSFELARRAARAGSSLRSLAAHPGYASTNLQRRGPEMSGRKLTARAMHLATSAIAQPAEGGALPQLYAASSPDAANGDFIGPGGPFEMRGSPKKVGASRAARSEQDAARLWELSEEMTSSVPAWP